MGDVTAAKADGFVENLETYSGDGGKFAFIRTRDDLVFGAIHDPGTQTIDTFALAESGEIAVHTTLVDTPDAQLALLADHDVNHEYLPGSTPDAEPETLLDGEAAAASTLLFFPEGQAGAKDFSQVSEIALIEVLLLPLDGVYMAALMGINGWCAGAIYLKGVGAALCALGARAARPSASPSASSPPPAPPPPAASPPAGAPSASAA